MTVAALLKLPLHLEPEYLDSNHSGIITCAMALSKYLISPKPQFLIYKMTLIAVCINFTKQQ